MNDSFKIYFFLRVKNTVKKAQQFNIFIDLLKKRLNLIEKKGIFLFAVT